MDEAKRFEKVEKLLAYQFKNQELLRQALMHASRRKKNKEGQTVSNERLEFLGDAILGFVITDLIYKKYPMVDEGELTRIRSNLVSRRTLAILIREFNLQNTLVVGNGISTKFPDSVLANLFEAIVGAWYLDGGVRRVQLWLKTIYEPRLLMVEKNRHEKNHKSILQQLSQKMWGEPPCYIDRRSSGPEHAKTFCVMVKIMDGSEFEGEGKNKKLAEQKAAAVALRTLKRKVAYKDILKSITG